ncbi:unnamed protein product [Cochlearia groenlandica]
MTFQFIHKIKQNPTPEDVGRIIINARIIGDDVKTLTTSDFVEVFIADDGQWCQCKEDLECFITEEGIDDDFVAQVSIAKLIDYVEEVTRSESFSMDCALEVGWDISLNDLFYDNHGWLTDTFESLSRIRNPRTTPDDTQIQEAIQVSLNETDIIPEIPANKLMVNSLPRKIYNKMTSSNGDAQICPICLEEFNDGERVVTLPCGHEFEEECIINWFEINHVCPLCRFKLPC